MYRHPDRQTSKLYYILSRKQANYIIFCLENNLSSDLFFLPGIAPASAPAIASIIASPAPPVNGIIKLYSTLPIKELVV